MSAPELLGRLRKLGARVWVEGDRLCLDLPESAATPELEQTLVASKAELLREIHAQARAVPVLRTKLLCKSRHGVEVLEVAPLDPSGPTRWERRLRHGPLALLTDATNDPDVAKTWVATLEAYEGGREPDERLPENGRSDLI
jgi:hypothetical protein